MLSYFFIILFLELFPQGFVWKSYRTKLSKRLIASEVRNSYFFIILFKWIELILHIVYDISHPLQILINVTGTLLLTKIYCVFSSIFFKYLTKYLFSCFTVTISLADKKRINFMKDSHFVVYNILRNWRLRYIIFGLCLDE